MYIVNVYYVCEKKCVIYDSVPKRVVFDTKLKIQLFVDDMDETFWEDISVILCSTIRDGAGRDRQITNRFWWWLQKWDRNGEHDKKSF